MVRHTSILVILGAVACGEPPPRGPAPDPAGSTTGSTSPASPPASAATPLVANAAASGTTSAAPSGSVPASAHGAPPSPSSACGFLAKTCHSHDKASEKAHACHKLGHAAASEQECEAKRAECTAACSGPAGDHHH